MFLMKKWVCFAILLVSLWSVLPVQAEENEAALKPTNKELQAVHRIGQVIDVLRSEAADAIWPKFRLQEPSLLTFQNGHVLAFHLNSQDSAWRRLSVDGQIALFSPTDKWDALKSPLNQSFPIENEQAYLFAFEVFDRDPFLPFLTFVHERFHHHQSSHFSEKKLLQDTVGYEDHLNGENLALMKMEEAILIDFLEALKKKENKNARISLLKRFVAIHTIRSKLLTTQSQKWEQLQQTMEGMADYVSIKLLDIYPRIPKFDALSHMQELLKNYLNDPRIIEGAIQWRHYGVGSVLGYALDDLEVAEWKSSVEKGKSLSFLLAQSMNLSDQEIQQLADAAKKDYQYSNVKDAIEKQLRDYQRDIAYFQQKYAETDGVVVFINKPKDKELNGGGSVAHTFQLFNGRSLSLLCSSTAVVQDNSWRLSFNRIPLLFQNRAGDQEFKMERALMLEIDGQQVPLATIIDHELERPFQSVSWKGEFSEFVSDNFPGMISGKGGKLSILFY